MVQKRANLQPFKLLETRLISDVDKLIEANYKNPVVAIQTLWLLILTTSVNDKINATLFDKLLV